MSEQMCTYFSQIVFPDKKKAATQRKRRPGAAAGAADGASSNVARTIKIPPKKKKQRAAPAVPEGPSQPIVFVDPVTGRKKNGDNISNQEFRNALETNVPVPARPVMPYKMVKEGKIIQAISLFILMTHCT